MPAKQISMSDFDVVAFDVDGTLSNSIPAHHEARLKGFAAEGFGHITREQHELGPTYGSTSADIVGGVLHAAGEIVDDVPFAEHPVVQRVRAARNRFFDEAASKGFEEQPGATDFVKLVASHFAKGNIAFVTSSPFRHVSPFMERYGLDAIIPEDLIIDEEVIIVEGLAPKPLPDPYQLAKKRMGATNMLVFEDTLSGIESAKRAGATVVAMGFDRYNRARFEAAAYPPDAIAMSYDEARALLDL